MAAILRNDNQLQYVVRYYGIQESKHKWRIIKEKMYRWGFITFCAFFISPYLFGFAFTMYLIYLIDLFSTFFKNNATMHQYGSLLQAQTADKVVSIIGYRVYEGEVDGHLSIIKSGIDKALATKQEQMMMNVNKNRWVGIDEKIAKTHIALIGKTGAGKTEAIRSFMDNIMHFGGGICFNDGKSDSKMLNEMMIQAKSHRRETSFRVLNFLKPDENSETNSFNFIRGMHPLKLTEFLSNLAFKGNADGNAAYFQGRGKSLLQPVIYSLYVRSKIAKEPYSLSYIQKSTEAYEVVLLCVLFYCVCKDIERMIRSNEKVMSVVNDKSLTIDNTPGFEMLEKLIAKVTQSPNVNVILDEAFKMKNASMQFIDCYKNSYKQIYTYLTSVWNDYPKYVNALCIYTYAYFSDSTAQLFADSVKDELDSKYKDFIQSKDFDRIDNSTEKIKHFFDPDLRTNNVIKLSDVKGFTNIIKKTMEEGKECILSSDSVKTNLGNEELANIRANVQTMVNLYKSDGSACIAKPTAEAIQQHSYAMQQWGSLFSTLTPFGHIFGQEHSEIDPISLFRDNQILYILLPPLELSKDQVEILGKIIIATIKSYAGSALGGQGISVHQTILNIARDGYTPKPFTLINLDEYGAYPVGDLDTILAQVRSINMSVVLGIQDFVSLKTSGTDDTAQKRALANTSKFLFKTNDRDVIEWANSMIAEEEIEENKYKKDASGELVIDTDVNMTRKKIIQVHKIVEADKGFGLLLLGSQTDRAIWVQSFYRGGKSDNVLLKHFVPITHFKNPTFQNI